MAASSTTVDLSRLPAPIFVEQRSFEEILADMLARVQQLLPPDVSPTLGPDASGVGWVYQYVLEDDTGFEYQGAE